MPMRPKAIVSGHRPRIAMKRTVYTFAMLHKAAKSALQHAEESADGRAWSALHCLITSAFSVEAYLNHAGEKAIRHWHMIERALGPEKKVDLLLSDCGATPHWGREPLQSVKHLIGVRNDLAHGRTARLDLATAEHCIDFKPGLTVPAERWEVLCNDIARVKRLHDKSGEFMRWMHDRLFGEKLKLDLLSKKEVSRSTQR